VMDTVLSLVGLMLTLAGLVGSFFNIQLSEWRRDLAALEQKVRLNKAQGTIEQQRAIVECRIELGRLANVQSYVVNALVLGFIVFVLTDSLTLIEFAHANPLYPNLRLALWVFLVFFVGVSAWLGLGGWKIAEKVKRELNPQKA
jgi:hypothetical protein